MLEPETDTKRTAELETTVRTLQEENERLQKLLRAHALSIDPHSKVPLSQNVPFHKENIHDDNCSTPPTTSSKIGSNYSVDDDPTTTTSSPRPSSSSNNINNGGISFEHSDITLNQSTLNTNNQTSTQNVNLNNLGPTNQQNYVGQTVLGGQSNITPNFNTIIQTNTTPFVQNNSNTLVQNNTNLIQPINLVNFNSVSLDSFHSLNSFQQQLQQHAGGSLFFAPNGVVYVSSTSQIGSTSTITSSVINTSSTSISNITATTHKNEIADRSSPSLIQKSSSPNLPDTQVSFSKFIQNNFLDTNSTFSNTHSILPSLPTTTNQINDQNKYYFCQQKQPNEPILTNAISYSSTTSPTITTNTPTAISTTTTASQSIRPRPIAVSSANDIEGKSVDVHMSNGNSNNDTKDDSQANAMGNDANTQKQKQPRPIRPKPSSRANSVQVYTPIIINDMKPTNYMQPNMQPISVSHQIPILPSNTQSSTSNYGTPVLVHSNSQPLSSTTTNLPVLSPSTENSKTANLLPFEGTSTKLLPMSNTNNSNITISTNNTLIRPKSVDVGSLSSITSNNTNNILTSSSLSSVSINTLPTTVRNSTSTTVSTSSCKVKNGKVLRTRTGSTTSNRGRKKAVDTSNTTITTTVESQLLPMQSKTSAPALVQIAPNLQRTLSTPGMRPLAPAIPGTNQNRSSMPNTTTTISKKTTKKKNLSNSTKQSKTIVQYHSESVLSTNSALKTFQTNSLVPSRPSSVQDSSNIVLPLTQSLTSPQQQDVFQEEAAKLFQKLNQDILSTNLIAPEQQQSGNLLSTEIGSKDTSISLQHQQSWTSYSAQQSIEHSCSSPTTITKNRQSLDQIDVRRIVTNTLCETNNILTPSNTLRQRATESTFQTMLNNNRPIQVQNIYPQSTSTTSMPTLEEFFNSNEHVVDFENFDVAALTATEGLRNDYGVSDQLNILSATTTADTLRAEVNNMKKLDNIVEDNVNYAGSDVENECDDDGVVDDDDVIINSFSEQTFEDLAEHFDLEQVKATFNQLGVDNNDTTLANLIENVNDDTSIVDKEQVQHIEQFLQEFQGADNLLQQLTTNDNSMYYFGDQHSNFNNHHQKSSLMNNSISVTTVPLQTTIEYTPQFQPTTWYNSTPTATRLMPDEGTQLKPINIEPLAFQEILNDLQRSVQPVVHQTLYSHQQPSSLTSSPHGPNIISQDYPYLIPSTNIQPAIIKTPLASYSSFIESNTAPPTILTVPLLTSNDLIPNSGQIIIQEESSSYTYNVDNLDVQLSYFQEQQDLLQKQLEECQTLEFQPDQLELNEQNTTAIELSNEEQQQQTASITNAVNHFVQEQILTPSQLVQSCSSQSSPNNRLESPRHREQHKLNSPLPRPSSQPIPVTSKSSYSGSPKFQNACKITSSSPVKISNQEQQSTVIHDEMDFCWSTNGDQKEERNSSFDQFSVDQNSTNVATSFLQFDPTTTSSFEQQCYQNHDQAEETATTMQIDFIENVDSKVQTTEKKSDNLFESISDKDKDSSPPHNQITILPTAFDVDTFSSPYSTAASNSAICNRSLYYFDRKELTTPIRVTSTLKTINQELSSLNQPLLSSQDHETSLNSSSTLIDIDSLLTPTKGSEPVKSSLFCQTDKEDASDTVSYSPISDTMGTSVFTHHAATSPVVLSPSVVSTQSSSSTVIQPTTTEAMSKIPHKPCIIFEPISSPSSASSPNHSPLKYSSISSNCADDNNDSPHRSVLCTSFLNNTTDSLLPLLSTDDLVKQNCDNNKLFFTNSPNHERLPPETADNDGILIVEEVGKITDICTKRMNFVQTESNSNSDDDLEQLLLESNQQQPHQCNTDDNETIDLTNSIIETQGVIIDGDSKPSISFSVDDIDSLVDQLENDRTIDELTNLKRKSISITSPLILPSDDENEVCTTAKKKRRLTIRTSTDSIKHSSLPLMDSFYSPVSMDENEHEQITTTATTMINKRQPLENIYLRYRSQHFINQVRSVNLSIVNLRKTDSQLGELEVELVQNSDYPSLITTNEKEQNDNQQQLIIEQKGSLPENKPIEQMHISLKDNAVLVHEQNSTCKRTERRHKKSKRSLKIDEIPNDDIKVDEQYTSSPTIKLKFKQDATTEKVTNISEASTAMNKKKEISVSDVNCTILHEEKEIKTANIDNHLNKKHKSSRKRDKKGHHTDTMVLNQHLTYYHTPSQIVEKEREQPLLTESNPFDLYVFEKHDHEMTELNETLTAIPNHSSLYNSVKRRSKKSNKKRQQQPVDNENESYSRESTNYADLETVKFTIASPVPSSEPTDRPPLRITIRKKETLSRPSTRHGPSSTTTVAEIIHVEHPDCNLGTVLVSPSPKITKKRSNTKKIVIKEMKESDHVQIQNHETLTNGTVTSSQPDEFVQNNVDDDEKNSLLSETPTGLKTKAKKSKTSRQRRGKSNRSHQSKRSTKTKDQFENEDNNKAITTEYAGLTRFEAQMFNWAQKPTTQQPHTIERDDGNIHNSDSDVILINSPAQSPFIQQKLKPKEELKRNDDIKSPSIIAKSNEQPIDTITSTVNVETKITDNLPETKCIETIEKEVCSSSNDSHPHSQEKTISRTTTPRAQIALETPSSVASPAQLLPPPPLIHIEDNHCQELPLTTSACIAAFPATQYSSVSNKLLANCDKRLNDELTALATKQNKNNDVDNFVYHPHPKQKAKNYPRLLDAEHFSTLSPTTPPLPINHTKSQYPIKNSSHSEQLSSSHGNYCSFTNRSKSPPKTPTSFSPSKKSSSSSSSSSSSTSHRESNNKTSQSTNNSSSSNKSSSHRSSEKRDHTSNSNTSYQSSSQEQQQQPQPSCRFPKSKGNTNYYHPFPTPFPLPTDMASSYFTNNLVQSASIAAAQQQQQQQNNNHSNSYSRHNNDNHHHSRKNQTSSSHHRKTSNEPSSRNPFSSHSRSSSSYITGPPHSFEQHHHNPSMIADFHSSHFLPRALMDEHNIAATMYNAAAFQAAAFGFNALNDTPSSPNVDTLFHHPSMKFSNNHHPYPLLASHHHHPSMRAAAQQFGSGFMSSRDHNTFDI